MRANYTWYQDRFATNQSDIRRELDGRAPQLTNVLSVLTRPLAVGLSSTSGTPSSSSARLRPYTAKANHIKMETPQARRQTKMVVRTNHVSKASCPPVSSGTVENAGTLEAIGGRYGALLLVVEWYCEVKIV